MIAYAGTPRYLIAPTAWKRPGRWWIQFLKPGADLSLPFPPMLREAGDRANPTTFWSVMDASGVNPNWLPREIMPGVLVCPDPAEVAHAAARRFVDCSWQAIAQYGRFDVALSGGNTPKALYKLLASSEFRAQVDWPRVHLYWGDERAVPPDDPESNYGMARRELILRVPIPMANVHRMEAEDAHIGRAAHSYEAVLRRELKLDDRGFPIFHLILL